MAIQVKLRRLCGSSLGNARLDVDWSEALAESSISRLVPSQLRAIHGMASPFATVLSLCNCCCVAGDLETIHVLSMYSLRWHPQVLAILIESYVQCSFSFVIS